MTPWNLYREQINNGYLLEEGTMGGMNYVTFIVSQLRPIISLTKMNLIGEKSFKSMMGKMLISISTAGKGGPPIRVL